MANLTGKIVRILDVIEGESDKGSWKRTGFVILSDGEPQRQVAFTVFGEKRVEQIKNLKVGNTVIVSYYLESREFNDRYYTEAYCNDVLVAKSVKVEGGANE